MTTSCNVSCLHWPNITGAPSLLDWGKVARKSLSERIRLVGRQRYKCYSHLTRCRRWRGLRSHGCREKQVEACVDMCTSGQNNNEISRPLLLAAQIAALTHQSSHILALLCSSDKMGTAAIVWCLKQKPENKNRKKHVSSQVKTSFITGVLLC